MECNGIEESNIGETMNEDPNQSQLCCRICLQSKCKLISIQSHNLLKAYKQLTGVSVEHDDGLPRELCVECATLLDKYHKFREKSIKGDQLLRQTIKENKRLSYSKNQHIRSILQQYYNYLSYCPTIVHLDIEPKLQSYDDTSPNNDETEYIKTEYLIDDRGIETEQFFAEPLQNDITENYDSATESIKQTKKLKKEPSHTVQLKKEKTHKSKRKIKKESSPKKTTKFNQAIAAQQAINDELIKEFFIIKELSFDEQLKVAEQKREKYSKFPYQCELCYRGFSSQASLDTHMVSHTPARGKSECKICHIRCTYDRYVRSHVRNVHLYQFSCRRCEFVVSARAVAVTHAEWHNGKRFSCDICDMVFEKKTTLFSHIRILHPSNVVCNYCGYSFINERGVRLHINSVHYVEKATKLSGPWCDECKVQFANDDALSVHNQIKHEANKPVRNTSIQYKRKGSESLERDTRSERHEIEKDGRPAVRNARQMSKANVYGHFMKKPTPCEICGLVVKSWTEYRTHFNKSHKDAKRTVYANPYHSDLMCHKCGKLFKYKVGLKEHLETHTSVRAYSCTVCHKSFKTDSRLKLHHNVHRGPTYSCTVCGKGFNQRGNRDRHITYTHSEEKRFKCESCEKCFKTNCERKLHIKHIHLKEPWPKRHRNRSKLIVNTAPTDSVT